MSLRVLVVDDSVVFRQAVSEALSGIPGVEVAGTAANGRLALSRIAALQPDIVTLDVEMPEMNGLETLEQINSGERSCAIILLTSLTARARELTVRALELGALDFLLKPEAGDPRAGVELLRAQLLPLIRAFESRVALRGAAKAAGPPAPTDAERPGALRHPAPRFAGHPIVLIGVSTGGPRALADLIPAMPADLKAPVFVVQHMPPAFTGPLAASLASKSALSVKEAAEGERARSGCVYLAPGGRHMKLERGGQGEIVIRLTSDPPEHNCRPAVDCLFRSAALHFPGRSIAAILTGMGRDGADGLRTLKRGGCLALAQDEASCVVFGMPKEAIQTGVVDRVLPLGAMAGAIVRAVQEAGR